MFNAKIQAHNLREIETEGRDLEEIEKETLLELVDAVSESICRRGWQLLSGFSINVVVTKGIKVKE